MRVHHPQLIGALATSCLYLGQACAIDFGDHFRLEGFATLGVFQADDPVAMVRADPRQKDGSLDGKLQFDADTILALQATVNPTGPLKGVVQLISKQDYQGSLSPRVEWAYLGWDVHQFLNVKLGRVVAPVFMTSDTRNVAFAQIMARPMNTVYQINPITNVDGGNIKWTHRLENADLGLEAMIGQSKVSNSLGTFKARRTYGLGARYNVGPWTLRGGITSMNLDIDSAYLSQAVATLQALPVCTNCSTVVPQRFRLSDIDARIQTLGLLYDDDTNIVQAEYAFRPSNSVLVTRADGWYIMAGRRMQDWTPYLGAGQFQAQESPIGLQPTDATYATAIDFQNNSLAGLGRGNRTQLTAGVRWDFAPKFALKLQWDQYDIAYPGYGKNVVVDYPIQPSPVSTFDGRVHSLSLNLDLLF